jgi:hypothetical protein
MYERQQENVKRELQQERLRSEQFAHQLQQEAATQWQKAITGVLALPTATALTVGATTLQVAAFIERGFEIFQESAESMRRTLDGARRAEGQRADWRAEPGTEQQPRS